MQVITTTSSRSSDEQPDAIQLGDKSLDNGARFKELLVNNASLLNLSLQLPGDDIALFFVQNSIFKPGTPHLTLHAGPDKLSPVVGVVYLAHCSTNTVGLGDPDSSATSMVWETLARTSRWTHATYRFEFLFGDEGRRGFVWQRTTTNPFDDQPNMELFEEGRPEVVLARYVSVGVFKWKRRGRLLLRDGFGDAWEAMVLLTGLALVQLGRRRARQRRH